MGAAIRTFDILGLRSRFHKCRLSKATTQALAAAAAGATSVVVEKLLVAAVAVARLLASADTDRCLAVQQSLAPLAAVPQAGQLAARGVSDVVHFRTRCRLRPLGDSAACTRCMPTRSDSRPGWLAVSEGQVPPGFR